MNPIRICRFFRQAVLAVSGFGLLTATLSAATFSYNNPDLVAAFRITGGSSDLVVNLGPVAFYEGLPLRTVVDVSNVQASQLAAAFPDLNGVSWSVSAAMRGNTNYPQFPLQTIWATSPRLDIYTPGMMWQRKGQFTQGTVAGQIDGIGAGAVTYGSSQPAGTNNTQTGIVISSTDANSYTTLMTSSGDFGGTFQGNAENKTPTNFTSTGAISRSVLYKMLPGSGGALNAPGQIIGFFDFKPDGRMTFTAGPAPERATITFFQMASGVSTVYFGTTNSVYYRLRFSDDLTTPAGNWSTNGVVLIGDGVVRSLQDTNVSPARFYRVESF